MRKDVIHNPLNSEDRLPYGGIRRGGRLYLSFKIFRNYDIREAYIVIYKDGENDVYYPMRWYGLDEGYDRFAGWLDITSTGLYFYRFEVRSPAGVFSIGADSLSFAAWQSESCWAATVYEPQYKPPEWLKQGVIYQIFPDRFNIGKDGIRRAKGYAVYHESWDEIPAYLPNEYGEIMNNDFFGGNLKGITEKLEYLKSLNVSCIYLNPVFDAYSNHKYDTGNYEEIDPGFGTEEDLKELVAEAGKLNIKIVLDGVFNHTGSDSKYFNKHGHYNTVGAYQSKRSPYFRWYNFLRYPDDYESWWGIKTLPSVNEGEQSYDDYINGCGGVIEKWMKAGVGGFRLDVVDELPDKFLDNLVHAVKRIKEDAVVIGEVWENAATKVAYSVRRRYFQGRQLDSVMNYPFRKAITAFIIEGDSDMISGAVNTVVSSYPKHNTDLLMNLLGTHDTERIITHLAGEDGYKLTRAEQSCTFIPQERKDIAVSKLKLAALLMYTLPGVPCIYYGDETGLEGYGDPFCRRTFPWGQENRELVDFFIGLGKLRDDILFREGYIKILYTAVGEIVYTRYLDGRRAYIAANSTNRPVIFDIDGQVADLLTNEVFTGSVIIPPFSARILI